MRVASSVSVIIPTYNRAEYLRNTLASLEQQSLPAGDFEVIVIDDGSTDGTRSAARESYPFRVRYVHQTNQGDAAARNRGVSQSDADLLVFLDDDILVAPGYLECMVRAHQGAGQQIVVGSEQLWLSADPPPIPPADQEGEPCPGALEPLAFVDVCSNNMSIRRQAYLDVGPMDNLDFPGSSIWCDVDFSYRAHLMEFEFYRSPAARCWHRDYVSASLDNRKKRMWKTAYRAVALFQKHPELREYLPMFKDKTPVAWQSDSPQLILRKLARRLASTGLALNGFEATLRLLGGLPHNQVVRTSLERWIVGGHIYRGYRAGRQALHPTAADSQPQEI